jgi:site-specific DNA recombinase
MSAKKYFSYIRVSTQRQGQHGTSLVEQQAAIERFAQSWNLQIIKRFEERETAAKQGRPVFLDMLKLLRLGRADGVVIHKIDRSARNLKDWADLGSLIDNGIDVHFASESLDLNSRGGRLSADIQAVVASDYIRNLSEEAKKGLYGRLKQGLYPFRAMIGYQDTGSGKPKIVDPLTAPLIRRAFELYASGVWGLVDLSDEMNRAGLRTKTGKKVTKTALGWILHNPFYMGVMHIKKTNEMYPGIHQPIVTKALFDQVQNVFTGKNRKKEKRHFFVFRRLISCERCGRLLSPEIQKGITYYRCRTRDCVRKCLTEKTVNKELTELFKKIEFSNYEMRLLRRLANVESNSFEDEVRRSIESIKLQQVHLRERSSRLADAYVNGIFDEATYVQKKNELVLEDLALNEKSKNATREVDLESKLDEFCELANSAYLSYKSGSLENKRDLVVTVTANIKSDGNSVSIKLKNPFQLVAERTRVQHGWPYREATRTVSAWIRQLFKILSEKSLTNS